MIPQYLIHLIILLVLTTGISALSTDEPSKKNVFNGPNPHPSQISSRNLETDPLYYSFIFQKGKVQVKLEQSYYEKNDITAIAPTGNTLMSIMISSDKTGFFGFSKEPDAPIIFKCDPSYCIQDNSSSEYKFSWFKGYASHINLNMPVSIAFGAWQLQTSALYFYEMPESLIVRGEQELGFIGLGTGLEAGKNFQMESPIFSIVHDTHSDSGNLIFGINLSLADTSKPAMTVTTTPNWEMQLASVSVGEQPVFFVNDSQPLKMIFDLIEEYVAFPEEIVYSIIKGLSHYTDTCDKTTCSPETPEGLPPIIFTLVDNTQISIGPEIYLKSYRNASGRNSYFVMNLLRKFRSRKMPNTLFFGREILSHFYTVFQQLNHVNTITLYALAPNITIEQEPSEPPQKKLSKHNAESITSYDWYDWEYIVIGICFVAIILFICVQVVQRKKNQNEQKEVNNYKRNINLELKESDTSSDEVPLTLKP